MSDAPSTVLYPYCGLNSLAQEVRLRRLRSIRNLLILIGLGTILTYSAFLAYAPEEVKLALDAALKEAHRSRADFPRAEYAQWESSALRITQLIYGCMIGCGVLFLALSALVGRFPVIATIASLVLYVAVNAILAVMSPLSLLSGVIIKIVIIAALGASISTAVSFERGRRAASLRAAEESAA